MIDLISYLIAGLWLVCGIAFAAVFTAGMIGQTMHSNAQGVETLTDLIVI